MNVKRSAVTDVVTASVTDSLVTVHVYLERNHPVVTKVTMRIFKA